ncbi:ankyrin repeat-containing protein [Anaeramoeba ignava]|uniref:Ankyrin repeat-containing protein n=1 Tax=Anaeramoeba ignava TaxID=1746090 RepID=A0A9Q0RBD0_ANAIG|nr:ankyrin repeat-containing protein [Anaeramoeba ignava]
MNSYLAEFQKGDFSHIELLQEVDVNNQDLRTPLWWACFYRVPLEILNTLLQKSANVNISDGFTPLYNLCEKGVDPELLRSLLAFGADNDTPLHKACECDVGRQNIMMLLTAGADVHVKNGSTPIDLARTPELKELLQFRTNIMDEMTQLYKRGERCDFEITTMDGKTIQSHETILSARLGPNFRLLSSISKNKKNEEMESFFRWIYGGIISGAKKKTEDLASVFGIQNITEKSGINGLLKDLRKLYLDEDSKDFTIIIGDENIRVHSVILMMRSELYRGMFVSVKDDSHRVTDYSGRSPEALRTLIKYFYLDELDPDLSDSIIEELQEAHDYYQLNENSVLQRLLKLRK